MSVHAFPRQRFLRTPEDEIRKRVDAWRRSRWRRTLRWILRHEPVAGFIAGALILLTAWLLGIYG